MSGIDFTEPFADKKVGIIYGEFTTQGGAEILNAQMARQLDAPIYTRVYRPDRFGDRMNDILSERIVPLDNGKSGVPREVGAQPLGPNPTLPPGYRAAGVLSTDDRLIKDVDTSGIQTDVLIAGDADGAAMAYQSDIPYMMYVHHSGKPLVGFFWDHFDAKARIIDKLKFLRERRRTKKDLHNVAKRSDMLLFKSERTADVCNDQ